ncbi:vasodilator-stimulated phosphoprotein-like [Plodia interpunctella]|uniref:vasodilator-stimulated phosphoprotein-like n=1 Tax=Plodia interpunctella TaxID=58824 RepID=UPI0023674F7D|nr:vasodilator-stimulated phosphoprotein-like [Plodia interpunctella]
MRLNVRIAFGNSGNMDKYPPHLHPPPYYPPPPHWPPPPPHHGPHGPPPPPHAYPPPPPGPYPYFYPATMMVPVPTPPSENQPTYITNYIYHGESSNPPVVDQVQIAETSGDYEWIPSTATTASSLTGRAVIGGHEGWDGSPLWVIRAWYNGDLIPGKLSVRHNAASVMHDGKEIPVQNIDVLCAKPDNLRWVPASNGGVPPGAISGGRTASGEQLYVGRARHQLSVTPGKVHPSHNCCYIAFAGAEVSHKVYDVLCRIS